MHAEVKAEKKLFSEAEEMGLVKWIIQLTEIKVGWAANPQTRGSFVDRKH